MGRVAWNRVLWTLTIVSIGVMSLWAWSDSSEAREARVFAALENGFQNPPVERTPVVWWHWVDDSVVFGAPHEPYRQSFHERQPGPIWMSSLPRTDYMLRQGQFVGDVLYFDDEATPLGKELGRGIYADLPDGHGFDIVNADRLLAELSSRDSRVMTRGSRSYRLLFLGPDPARMSMVVLGRVRNLIRLGAVVMGDPPQISPANSADAHAFQQLVASIWTKEAESASGARFGYGRVFSGRSVADVLATVGVARDVEYPRQDGMQLLVSHRTMPGAEVYFIANATDRADILEVSFRVSGRRAELWDPATGGMTAAADVRSEHGRTTVPLSLTPHDQLFVVFRE